MQARDRMLRPIIDFRLYRLAWIPAAIAVVVLMFSFAGAPAALEPATPPANFDAERVAADTRRIAARAPDRTPGSDDDGAIAQLVAQRFGEIPAGTVNEDTFETDFDGSDVEVRNVWLTLPGDAASTIVVVAPRDSAEGPGGATSAAATAALLELASALGVAGHSKTFVLASTSGGATGATELIGELPEPESISAVIVLTQPGATEPHAPYVVTSSTSDVSGSVQLERTAELAVESQTQRGSSEPGAFGQLARLAIPAGLGPQAPLIAAGFDAVTITSAGERPLDGAEADTFAGDNADAFGRAVHSTINALDATAEPVEHGPGTHLELSDNLVPGWTLSLLALTLLFPAAVAAVDAGARALRRKELFAGLAWGAARALPPIGALAALYALALAGVIPRPSFPFDPALHGLGARAWIAFALIATAFGLSIYALRALRITGSRAPAAAIAGLGAVTAIAVLLAWLANPYLALLLAPVAHVWLLAATRLARVWAAVTIVAAVASLVPLAAALGSVSGALELGGDAPWFFTLLVADGQLGLSVALAICFALGGLIGTCALALRREPAHPDPA
jgi:hypothetical protein